MSDYYTESQMQRIEQAAYDGAMLEAGKEWERQRYEFGATEAELAERVTELEAEVTKCHELQDSYCARIAELEAAQRWIPVGERLPEPYTRVLACIKSGYMEVDYMYSEPIVDVGSADFNSLDNVTHWMPLPQSPEVQE